MAMPCTAISCEQLVHFRLGADVDAAGRLVDDQDARLERQPAGQHHLLLIAAREVLDRLFGPGHADVEATAIALHQPALRRRGARNPSAGACRERRERRFSRTASSRNSACCLRSSGTRPMPCADRILRRADGDRRAVDRTSPAVWGSAPKRQRASSVRPEPTSPAMPRISPRRTTRRYVLEHHRPRIGDGAAPRQPLDFEDDVAGRARRQRLEKLARRAADHHADDAIDGEPGDRPRCRSACRRAAR